MRVITLELEISHRSKPAIKVIDDTKENLTKLLNIPDTHEVFLCKEEVLLDSHQLLTI